MKRQAKALHVDYQLAPIAAPAIKKRALKNRQLESELSALPSFSLLDPNDTPRPPSLQPAFLPNCPPIPRVCQLAQALPRSPPACRPIFPVHLQALSLHLPEVPRRLSPPLQARRRSLQAVRSRPHQPAPVIPACLLRLRRSLAARNPPLHLMHHNRRMARRWKTEMRGCRGSAIFLREKGEHRTSADKTTRSREK